MGNIKTDKKAESVALNYLSYRDRSVFEIESHLKKKGYTEEEISACIEKLKEWDLIDDEEFCKKYIRYSKENKRGSLRIRNDLREKGIDDTTINLCLEEGLTRDEEVKLALEIGMKMVEGVESIDLDEKLMGKIARRLGGRGFGGNVIYTVLDKLKSS